jgi:hypothetical protein
LRPISDAGEVAGNAHAVARTSRIVSPVTMGDFMLMLVDRRMACGDLSD